jgi:hypothetical protein
VRIGAAALVISVPALVVAGWAAEHRFAATRYRADGVPAAHAWAQTVSHKRIALSGEALYPLYGADLTNQVEVPLVRLGRGDVVRVSTCSGWRRALAAGRYDYAVIYTGWLGVFPALGWTRAIPGAIEVAHGDGSYAYRLPSTITSTGCS